MVLHKRMLMFFDVEWSVCLVSLLVCWLTHKRHKEYEFRALKAVVYRSTFILFAVVDRTNNGVILRGSAVYRVHAIMAHARKMPWYELVADRRR